MAFQVYENLAVVQKAHFFVVSLYKVSKGFPSHEQFGLVSQIRRAAVSIPANICEGKARGSDRELIRFMIIARASLTEVRYLLMLARDLEYLTREQYTSLQVQAEEIAKMMGAMLSTIKRTLRATAIPLRPKKAESRKLRADSPTKEVVQ